MAFNKNLEIQKIITSKFSRKRRDENGECFNEDFFDIVKCAHWKCTVTDEETGIFEEVFGTTHFQYPEEEVIPFSELTKSQILSWMQDHPDVEDRVSSILGRLNIRIEESKKQVLIQKLSFDSLPD